MVCGLVPFIFCCWGKFNPAVQRYVKCMTNTKGTNLFVSQSHYSKVPFTCLDLHCRFRCMFLQKHRVNFASCVAPLSYTSCEKLIRWYMLNDIRWHQAWELFLHLTGNCINSWFKKGFLLTPVYLASLFLWEMCALLLPCLLVEHFHSLSF